MPVSVAKLISNYVTNENIGWKRKKIIEKGNSSYSCYSQCVCKYWLKIENKSWIFKILLNKEIKDLSIKRELERSRASGVISSRKENNQFMDKQLRKLNE